MNIFKYFIKTYNLKTLEQINSIQKNIEYYKTTLKKIKDRPHRGDCTLFYTDDYTMINGYYDRTHIPINIGYDIVVNRIEEKIKNEEKKLYNLIK